MDSFQTVRCRKGPSFQKSDLYFTFIFIDEYNSPQFLAHSPQTQVYSIQNTHRILSLKFNDQRIPLAALSD